MSDFAIGSLPPMDIQLADGLSCRHRLWSGSELRAEAGGSVGHAALIFLDLRRSELCNIARAAARAKYLTAATSNASNAGSFPTTDATDWAKGFRSSDFQLRGIVRSLPPGRDW